MKSGLLVITFDEFFAVDKKQISKIQMHRIFGSTFSIEPRLA